MDTDQLLLDIVGGLYEAAAEATLWPRVLQKLAAITRANAVSLPLFESLTSPSLGLIVAVVNLQDDFRNEHSKYAHLNPYFIRGAHWFSEGRALVGEMVLPTREFLETEYYNDFLRRFDLCYHCGGAVLRQQSAITMLRINRPHRGPPFGERELAVLRVLMPHFQRALQLRQHLAAIEAQRRGLLEGIDALPTGFVLVDPRGKMLLMNRSAQAILSQYDGLSATGQSLCAARRSESEKLREVVCNAARTGTSRGTGPGGAISISRPSRRRPYSILVCPLRLAQNPVGGTGFPAAAIFISDPDACPTPEQQTLRQLFGLTVAESRLAQVLLQGSTLQKSAELLGITRNTAHSQLRAIFDKSNTSRQAELMRVLGGAVAGVKLSVTEKKAA